MDEGRRTVEADVLFALIACGPPRHIALLQELDRYRGKRTWPSSYHAAGLFGTRL